MSHTAQQRESPRHRQGLAGPAPLRSDFCAVGQMCVHKVPGSTRANYNYIFTHAHSSRTSTLTEASDAIVGRAPALHCTAGAASSVPLRAANPPAGKAAGESPSRPPACSTAAAVRCRNDGSKTCSTSCMYSCSIHAVHMQYTAVFMQYSMNSKTCTQWHAPLPSPPLPWPRAAPPSAGRPCPSPRPPPRWACFHGRWAQVHVARGCGLLPPRFGKHAG